VSTPYPLGAHPSPVDLRDEILTPEMIQAAAAGLTLPSRYLTYSMPPHLNQIGGTCTTYGGDQLKRWQEKRDGHGVRNYDHLKMYSWQKLIDGISGEGSTGRAWCQVAYQRGIPLIGQTSGFDKISGYWNVDIGKDWDVLKAAIMAFGPVMVSNGYPNSWFTPKNGLLPPPAGGFAGALEGAAKPGDPVLGRGHPRSSGPGLLLDSTPSICSGRCVDFQDSLLF